MTDDGLRNAIRNGDAECYIDDVEARVRAWLAERVVVEPPQPPTTDELSKRANHLHSCDEQGIRSNGFCIGDQALVLKSLALLTAALVPVEDPPTAEEIEAAAEAMTCARESYMSAWKLATEEKRGYARFQARAALVAARAVRVGQDTTEAKKMSAHEGIVDRMTEGVNELYCTCGEQLFPVCDVSSASIIVEHRRHRESVRGQDKKEQ